MNNRDYEQKKRECWEQFWHKVNESINRCPKTYEDLEAALYTAFDRAYSLGKQEKDAEETMIQGWVARDLDGEVFLYENKPERGYREWLGRISSEFDFQQLKWESDPIEVEIITKRKKNG